MFEAQAPILPTNIGGSFRAWLYLEAVLGGRALGPTRRLNVAQDEARTPRAPGYITALARASSLHFSPRLLDATPTIFFVVFNVHNVSLRCQTLREDASHERCVRYGTYASDL